MFNWLKNLGRGTAAPDEQTLAPARPPTMQQAFADAELFTEWVDEYLIRAMPWRSDFDVLPDEEIQRDLNITFLQRERLVKEHSVLRLVGVLVFVRERYGDGRYQAMLNDIAARLANALELEAADAKGTLGQALDDYSSGFAADDSKTLAVLYMRRVYEDSDHYLRILHAGVGQTAVIEISGSYEVIWGHYFEVVVGHRYETEVLLKDAIARELDPKAQGESTVLDSARVAAKGEKSS